MNEFELIKKIKKLAGNPLLPVVIGIGDDCAALRSAGNGLFLMTADSLVEDVHFRRRFTTPGDIGWKSLAVNLSDIAAMGGCPGPFLLSMIIPRKEDPAFVMRVVKGVLLCAGRHGARLAGGNVSAAPSDSLIIDITATGTVRRGLEVRRSGATPGDLVCLAGYTGLSAAGLRFLERGVCSKTPGYATCISAHNRPIPRISLGLAISEARIATSMIDVSDGLIADLGHICKESGVGATLDASLVPIHKALDKTAKALKVDPLVPALSGGEDYALAFTVRSEDMVGLERLHKIHKSKITVIGRIKRGSGVKVLNAPNTLDRAGFDHFSF